jgi:hypothetical protein
MTDAALGRERTRMPRAGAALQGAAAFWFAVAFAGQMMFAVYIAIFYAGTALDGDWAQWNRRLINGLVEGDLAGNTALVAHLALACVISFCGPLQFVPAIRKHAIGFHRWNGRIYITTAFVISVGAIYMIATRGAGGFNAIAIQLNAVLIMAGAAMTLRHALARRIDLHHRWALRTFVLVSGVWFLRVGYVFLGVLFQGRPPGVGDNLDGPTDLALAYISFFLPLAVLQLYFLAKDSASPSAKWAMAGALVIAALVTGVGVIGNTLGSWLPRIMIGLG